MRKFQIAEGRIEGIGRIAETPIVEGDDHHTWWYQAGIDLVPLFKVIE